VRADNTKAVERRAPILAESKRRAEPYHNGRRRLDLANANVYKLLAFQTSVEIEAWE
jgi:hypothetical protein